MSEHKLSDNLAELIVFVGKVSWLVMILNDHYHHTVFTIFISGNGYMPRAAINRKLLLLEKIC